MYDIPVLHVPGFSPEAVAEFAMGLCLTVNRHIHKAYARTRDFNMNINGLMGRDMSNKTAGIIGTGRIGQAMIRICKGFGMRVIAYDVYPNKNLDVEYVDIDTLFSKSDMISLHCPLTPDTHYIMMCMRWRVIYFMKITQTKLWRMHSLQDLHPSQMLSLPHIRATLQEKLCRQ